MKYWLLLILTILIACDSSRVFEDYVDNKDAFWHLDSVRTFSFEIPDAEQDYNILATFRNSSAYPFYNIYFQFMVTDSLDSVVVRQLKEADLFDPKTGQPLGSGLGDFFDHSIPVLENFRFPSTGQYSVKLQQQMRLDTLPYLLSVGARVELVSED